MNRKELRRALGHRICLIKCMMRCVGGVGNSEELTMTNRKRKVLPPRNGQCSRVFRMRKLFLFGYKHEYDIIKFRTSTDIRHLTRLSVRRSSSC